MPIKILMPALSPTMTEGNIAKWIKKEGDKVKPGELIAEIETDKATMEVEAIDEGIIGKIFYPEGSENVKVNSLIAVILEEGENLSVISGLSHDIAPLQKEVAAVTIVDVKPSIASRKSEDRVIASPLAKRLAQINNIDITKINGTGPHDRVIKVDIERVVTAPIAGASRLVPNNNIRKIIAKRLLESKQTVPHFYLTIECNITKLLDARQDLNLRDDVKISVNDLVIMATGKALRKVPEANASWGEDAIRYYNDVDLSIAVAIDNGLITPIIRNANLKTIFELSSEMKRLAQRARDNKLLPEEFQGGSFSISNLGMYGIKNFNAIINPPQSCILAVGSANKKPIVDGEVVKIATVMEVTLSADHRVVDGAVGAKFLSEFRKYIENPLSMLLE